MEGSIRKILVPIDGSFRASEFALRTAEKHGSEVILFHAIPIGDFIRGLGVGSFALPEPIEAATERIRKEAQKWFDGIIKRAEKSGIGLRTEVSTSTSSTVQAIVDCARRENVDLIVIGTRGHSSVANLMIGSVASGVVASAPCSVTVIR